MIREFEINLPILKKYRVKIKISAVSMQIIYACAQKSVQKLIHQFYFYET